MFAIFALIWTDHLSQSFVSPHSNSNHFLRIFPTISLYSPSISLDIPHNLFIYVRISISLNNTTTKTWTNMYERIFNLDNTHTFFEEHHLRPYTHHYRCSTTQASHVTEITKIFRPFWNIFISFKFYFFPYWTVTTSLGTSYR